MPCNNWASIIKNKYTNKQIDSTLGEGREGGGSNNKRGAEGLTSITPPTIPRPIHTHVQSPSSYEPALFFGFFSIVLPLPVLRPRG